MDSSESTVLLGAQRQVPPPLRTHSGPDADHSMEHADKLNTYTTRCADGSSPGAATAHEVTNTKSDQ